MHPPSEHIPVARANGITHARGGARCRGRGGAVMGGQASAISLDGWTIEEMMLRPSVALVVNWPTLGGGGGGSTSRRLRGARGRSARSRRSTTRRSREIEDWIERARRYQQVTEKAAASRIDRNLKLEALGAGTCAARLPLLVRADDDRDIKNAIEFCDEAQAEDRASSGGDEARTRSPTCSRRRGVPVILGPMQAMPSDDEPYDAPITTPGVLQKAGVKFALSTFNSSDSRNLPYEIGNAVSYGLPRDEALQGDHAVSRADPRPRAIGSATLEPGKIANLIVTNGDPLEFRTEVTHLFINGQPTSTENKHRSMYEKWRSRPRPAQNGAPTATKQRAQRARTRIARAASARIGRAASLRCACSPASLAYNLPHVEACSTVDAPPAPQTFSATVSEPRAGASALADARTSSTALS